MKSRKQVWIAALCLFSAIAIAVAFTTRTTSVHAAKHVSHANRTALAQPAAYIAAPALRNALMLDDDASPTRVTGNLQPNRPVLPKVELFTLTPPNPAQGISKTVLAVRFAGTMAERLASQIPITLGSQNVVLRRSAGDPRTFATSVNFDWQTFAKEQALRKEAANKGTMVPLYEGHVFVRKEKMQFVDPAQIQDALQSHHSIQFSGQVLVGPPSATVVPDHELMIIAQQVVENPTFTSDPCLPGGGSPSGAWTFTTLMEAIACSGNANCNSQTTLQIAENMLGSMLALWQSPQQVNNGAFTVQPRALIGTLGLNGTGTDFLGNWPVDHNNVCTPSTQNPQGLCPSLPNAPVHLNAIVNRIDLGQNDPPFPPAGELRFVFGVTTDATAGHGVCHAGQPFNIILEYNVPSGISAPTWAGDWNSLPIDPNDGFLSDYLNALESLTSQVVALSATNACGGASCLAQIRTNEVLLGGNDIWEQRQFQLSQDGSGNPILQEGTIFMTPDESFNVNGNPPCGTEGLVSCNVNAGTLVSYLDTYELPIVINKGALPIVPDDWPNEPPPSVVPLLGGSAFNGSSAPANAFWVGSTPVNTPTDTARIYFSANTCNGCHGLETATNFQQVAARAAGSTSALSNFLVGFQNGAPCPLNSPCDETVPDPNPAFQGQNITTSFGDIARRMTYLQNQIGNGPESGGLLLPFLNQPIGVH